MYIPTKFQLTDEQVEQSLRSGGLAYLLTPGADGLAVTPMPLILAADGLTLAGHMARANPHWRTVDTAESVAIFNGPQAYISPAGYETKAETGKVVPTWNYETIVVHGRVRIHDDIAWLRQHVGELSDHHESSRPEPWAVDDAPEKFIDGQLKAIVGVELTITRWEGKAKMSQNQPARNQQSVIAALRSSDLADDRVVAERIARFAQTAHT